MSEMIQLAKVKTGLRDGDEFGNEWDEHFILFQTQDDDGAECFDIFEDDGEGNGTMVCRGYHKVRMTSLVLRLGDLVEWRAGVPLDPGPIHKAGGLA